MKIQSKYIITLISLLFATTLINAQSVEQLKAKAKKYDPAARLYLGLLYQEGKRVEQNDSLAAYWFQKAANQGLAEAQVLLGNCYREGRGVEKDTLKAFALYEMAAGCDASLAMDALGDCYYYGIAVERDVIRARYYYNLAAKKGYKKAKIKYDKIRFKKDEDAIIEL